MFHPLASLIGALAATTLLAGAGAVSAESLSDPTLVGAGFSSLDAPLGAPTELRIELKGTVAPRCDLTSPPALGETLAVSQSGTTEAGFEIDCNTPFRLRVRSAHGGFANDHSTPGIQSLATYELGVSVRTDDGLQDLGWCEAAALTESMPSDCSYAPASRGGGWSSGDATAINQSGTVRLRWDNRESETPLLGVYRDTIVIELEVRS
jgi:hypothetical protein